VVLIVGCVERPRIGRDAHPLAKDDCGWVCRVCWGWGWRSVEEDGFA
jgi:hypothetical protein